MAPETVELIEKIESERARVRELLRHVDQELDQPPVVSDSELEASDAEAVEAIETLRRAGLIKA